MPSTRALGWALIEVGTVSTAFPIIASLLSADQLPSIVGLVDVALGGVFVLLAFWVDARARPLVTEAHRLKAFRIVRTGSAALLVLLAMYFVSPASVSWTVLLVGLAWRAWLGIWVLPSVLAAIDRNRAGG